MIYIRLKQTVIISGRVATLADVADVFDAESHLDAARISIPVVGNRVDAMDVLEAVSRVAPGVDVQLLGAAATLCTQPKRSVPKALKALFAAVVCVFLFLGSGMAITYFHADVDMPGAQAQMIRMLLGDDEPHPLLAAIPYAIGIGLGAAVFLSPKGSPSPLAIKMMQQKQEADEYQVTQEGTTQEGTDGE